MFSLCAKRQQKAIAENGESAIEGEHNEKSIATTATLDDKQNWKFYFSFTFFFFDA